MTNDTRKLVPIELSMLDEIENPEGFWIFGSKQDSNGKFTSGKYRFNRLEEYARDLQLERRISLTMETDETELFIGEEMTIYKIDALNVDSLSINGETFSNLTDKVLNKKIDKMSKVVFKVNRSLTDPKAYVFIYAKATMP